MASLLRTNFGAGRSFCSLLLCLHNVRTKLVGPSVLVPLEQIISLTGTLLQHLQRCRIASEAKEPTQKRSRKQKSDHADIKSLGQQKRRNTAELASVEDERSKRVRYLLVCASICTFDLSDGLDTSRAKAY